MALSENPFRELKLAFGNGPGLDRGKRMLELLGRCHTNKIGASVFAKSQNEWKPFERSSDTADFRCWPECEARECPLLLRS